jgi:hypothetical protein
MAARATILIPLVGGDLRRSGRGMVTTMQLTSG